MEQFAAIFRFGWMTCVELVLGSGPVLASREIRDEGYS